MSATPGTATGSAPEEPVAASLPRLSVSVAMATYNGAEFLENQLASIAAQTTKPNELVVCDDGSSDGTVEIIERFAREAPFEVTVYRNPTRLGFGENFLKAARLCKGELIAWSDQDDEWMPEKLSRCVEEFEKQPDVLLVIHSTQLGDWLRHGRPVVSGGLSRYRARRREERMLRRQSVYTPAELPLEISVWGHSSVISRRVLEIADALADTHPGIVGEFSGHDTWTSFVALGAGKVALLPDVLVKYRQHGEQIAGASAPRTLATRAQQSAGQSGSAVLDQLERQATRAFFRAAVLAQLAARLDLDAGFGNDAHQFRLELGKQVVSQPEVGFARGALARCEMWRRHAEVMQRRLELWRQPPASGGAIARLVRNAASGDYGRADRGGLGWRSFARDLWRVAAGGGRS